MSASLALQPMTPEEGRWVTDKIRDDMRNLWHVLLDAYERDIHIVLGYASWHAYAAAELDLGRRRSYQLIDAGRVARALECTIVHSPPTEGVAREFVPLLDSPQALKSKWEEAVRTAPRDDEGVPVITARHVRSIVRDQAPAEPPLPRARAAKETERPKNDDDRFDDLMAAWIVAPEAVRQKFLAAIGGAIDAEDNVDPICWGEFVAHRKAIRKPLSSLSAAKNRKVLSSLSVAQQRQAVDTTIANNWVGIFPPKASHGTSQAPRPTSAVDRVRAAAAERERAARAAGRDY